MATIPVVIVELQPVGMLGVDADTEAGGRFMGIERLALGQIVEGGATVPLQVVQTVLGVAA